MGLSAAFLGGFVDAANRSVYENRMAKHEQSIQDRANFREDEKEAKARADKVKDDDKATQVAINAATALSGTQGDLLRQRLDADSDAIRLANEKDFDTKLAYVMQQYPGLPEDLAKTFAEGDISFITSMAENQRKFLPEERRFNTVEEATLLRAQTMAGTMRPGNLAEGVRYEDTDWYNKVVQSIVQGRPIDELAEDGWKQELVLNEAGQVTDVQSVFTDPDMYAPDRFEYDNLASAANTVLSVINTMTPDDLILDAEGDILQGDMRIAFHNLEQLASDLYVRQNGRMRENVVTDRIFTRERLELLAELTDTRMELPNELIMLANDPDGLAAIQTMDDAEELLDAYDNLIARKKLHRQGILPADEVAIDAALMAISTNPAFMQFTEAKKTEEINGRKVVDPAQGFTIEEVPTGTGLSAQARKIYTLNDVGLNKIREAYELHASQPRPKRQTDSLIPIERYVADLFGFSHINPLDREAINQLIKQHEDSISLGVIETNGV